MNDQKVIIKILHQEFAILIKQENIKELIYTNNNGFHEVLY